MTDTTSVVTDRMLPTLDELALHPEQAMTLLPAEAAARLAKVEGLAAILRLVAAQPSKSEGVPAPDRLLTAEQVGERLGFSTKQVYRRAARWSFTRRPSEGTLRFSERGLERYMAETAR
jgi:predicted DNA-binding transcriptional regulator AlpA